MINKESRNDTLEGLLKEFSERALRNTENSLPCVVLSVSSDRRRVSVQPLINVIGTDGTTIPRSQIDDITVYQAGAGDTLISFPVKAGDIGWIDACDRDITLFLQSYDAQDPPTRRLHSFSDSRFIPDIMTNFTIAGEDSTALVIQNRNGTVKIALDQDEIRITNDTVDITIDDSSITGTVPGGVTINSAQITSDGDFITSDGKSLRNHVHPILNGSSAPGPTGAPA